MEVVFQISKKRSLTEKLAGQTFEKKVERKPIRTSSKVTVSENLYVKGRKKWYPEQTNSIQRQECEKDSQVLEGKFKHSFQ